MIDFGFGYFIVVGGQVGCLLRELPAVHGNNFANENAERAWRMAVVVGNICLVFNGQMEMRTNDAK